MRLGFRPYNAGNIPNARKMRILPTPAENKMREEILKYKPLGYKFTRQKPLGSFIADFYCAQLALVIEVDGEIHKKRVQYDKERTLYFVNCGISVVRYWNNEVLMNIDNTYRDLLEFIKELESQKQSFKSPC